MKGDAIRAGGGTQVVIQCHVDNPLVVKAQHYPPKYWWRHQMETFSALLAICAGNSPVTGELPAQRPVTRSFDVFFDLCLNKRLSKQWWGWWFETPSRTLRHHCNVFTKDIPWGRAMGYFCEFEVWSIFLLFKIMFLQHMIWCQCFYLIPYLGLNILQTMFSNAFFKENLSVLIEISQMYVSKGPITKNAALTEKMALYCPGNKPLSEPVPA